jgi:hypothetical protein
MYVCVYVSVYSLLLYCCRCLLNEREIYKIAEALLLYCCFTAALLLLYCCRCLVNEREIATYADVCCRMLTYALLLQVSVERARDRRGAVNLLKGP